MLISQVMDKGAVRLKQAIVAYAHALGFDLVRVTTAAPFPETQRVLEERIKAGLLAGLPWFDAQYARDAGNPAYVMPHPRSIISVGISYLCDGGTDASRPKVDIICLPTTL